MSNMTSVSGEASGSSGNMADHDNIRQQTIVATIPQQQLRNTGASGSGNVNTASQIPVKRKRNLPGTPDPDAEVVALSPRTLMATNRFICEICNKGFQRDQNLQLHRRGHNLPWKLKQRTSTEVKKRVYICPEPTCVHHDPTRALGDLTGIKKHFCRKHGEKKWKCDKCSKRYAVQSDWKAHSKTCGTREYRCDCGTLFSRRDSFITHRAFCDALAEDGSRGQDVMNNLQFQGIGSTLSSSPVKPINMPSAAMHLSRARLSSSPWEQSAHDINSGASRTGLSLILGQDRKDFVSQIHHLQANPNPMDVNSPGFYATKNMQGLMGLSDHGSPQMGQNKPLFPMPLQTNSNSGSMYSGLYTSGFRSSNPVDFGDLGSPNHHQEGRQSNNHSAQMSATALLQKAAQMGATASSSPLLPAFSMAGPEMSTTSGPLLRPSWHESSPHEQSMDQFHPFNNHHVSTHSLGSQYFSGSHQKPLENSALHESLMNSLYGTDSTSQADSFCGQVLESRTNLGANGFVRGSGNGGSQRVNVQIGGKLQDGGDKLTRDFLGVGAGGRIVGGIPRALSEHNLSNVRSQLESEGIELDSYGHTNTTNGSQTDIPHGQSAQKSWEVS